MSYTWFTVRATDGHAEPVECYPSLDLAIADLALLAWEEMGNHWVDYVADEATGEAVAIALFGPGMELVVTLADGRVLRFEMPESYRDLAYGRWHDGGHSRDQ